MTDVIDVTRGFGGSHGIADEELTGTLRAGAIKTALLGDVLERFLKQKKYLIKESIETDSIEVIGLLVERGAGIAILPQSPALKVIGTRIREIELGVDTFYREVGLIERTDNPRAHLNGDFWRVLNGEMLDF